MIITGPTMSQELSRLLHNNTQNHTSSEKNKARNNPFGTAFKTSFSPEALSFIQDLSSIDFTEANSTEQHEFKTLVLEIIEGIVEHFDMPIGLDKIGAAKIQEAGKSLLQELFSTLESARTKTIDHSQIRQLQAANEVFHEVVEAVYIENTSKNHINDQSVEAVKEAIAALLADKDRMFNAPKDDVFDLKPAPPNTKVKKKPSRKLKLLVLILHAQLRRKKFDLQMAPREEAGKIKTKIMFIEEEIKSIKAKLQMY